MSKINIAIDGPTAVGKTTIGNILAKKLHYQFIDTGIFYRYLGYKYSYAIHNSSTNIINNLNKLKNENLLNEINTTIKNLSQEDYFYSGQQAAELSKNDKLHGNTIKKQETSDEEIEFYIEIKNWKLSNEVDNYALEMVFPDQEVRLTFMRNLLDYYNARVIEYKRIEKVMPKARNHPLFFKAKTWREKILKNSKLGATLAVTHAEESNRLLKNNLHQLYSIHNGFNFYVNYYTKKEQTIRVRKSLRILNKPSPKYCLTRQYIKKQYDILSESSIDIQIVSPISVHSNSTYITDDGFVVKDSQKFESNSQDLGFQELEFNSQNFELNLECKYITKQNGTIKDDKIIFSDEEIELRMDDDSDLPTEEEALKIFFREK
ncbi:14729_t:CDS:2 [Gigaspora margarita]|uniref:(d)CMP kinase n=1 Tax=Gigaspora margarita TaxID=4874 RepID=A0ABM8W757_GIGMA|nr:14729_t:CDS:2 [Gigaspora margarita]